MTRQTDKHTSYFELRDALGQPGCAVCRLAEKTVRQFLDTFMYENVTNPHLRLEIRAARGFCPAHSWQLADLGGVSGIAILYRDILNAMLTALETEGDQPRPGGGLRRLQQALLEGRGGVASSGLVDQLGPQAPCQACVHRDDRVERGLKELLEHIHEADFIALFQASQGLCLRHLRQAVRMARDERAYQRLVQMQLDIWRPLRADLDELIRKHDYRFASETMGAEGDSWLRAVAAIAGRRGYGADQ